MKHSAHYRIESIDLLRGMVMVIMALDHARMYFGMGYWFSDPTNLSTTTPLLFFTRWITHFCAPAFVFLAGTSAFLYGAHNKSHKAVSWFLFTRGVWLLFVELIIVNFAWTFDITLSFHILQVIWAMGMSMLCLSALVFLPKQLIFIIGILLVAGHNLLDSISMEGTTVTNLIWYALHQEKMIVLDSHSIIYLHYPLIPWIGLMALGYIFGMLYQEQFSAERRNKWLWWMGIGAVLLFVLLRTFNLYGDPSHWSPQHSFVFSIFSFVNTTKYPPSLLYILMTIGPSLVFLALTEGLRNKAVSFFVTFGRVPFFFYVIHIYFIHLLAVVAMIYAGRSWGDCILTAHSLITKSLEDYGFGLYVVYLIWFIVVALLYPLCKWYNEYKATNRGKWWLRYL
jgi:uncharacterized membrane protein